MKALIIDNNNNDIKEWLSAVDNGLVCLETSSYTNASMIVDDYKDISLICVCENKGSWKEFVSKLSNKKIKGKIVIISDEINNEDLTFAYKNNVAGIILSNLSKQIKEKAVAFILAGGILYPPTFPKEVELSIKYLHEDAKHIEMHLTNRQEEVLMNLSKGLSNKQIAYEMNLAEATVKLHINALLRSLGVSNRTHAVITAQKLGLI